MRRVLSSLLIVCASVAAIYILSGCSTTSPNPAAPPAPPIELPSPLVLRFVEFDELTTDLSTLTQSGTPSISKAILPGDDVAYLIQGGAFLVQMYENEILIPLTEGLGGLDIPIDENIQPFEGEVTFTMYSDFLQSSLLGPHTIKLDFSDFDLDDDGATEGCSGNTAQLPVCIRAWLDGERYLAWVFETYPVYADDPATTFDDRTVGKGRYKLFLDYVAGVAWEIATFYEQTVNDAEGKMYDLFLKGTNIDRFTFFGFTPDDFEPKGARIHLRVSRDGPEETALKSIDANQAIDGLFKTGPDTIYGKNAQRYIEGTDLWAASVYADTVSNKTISIGTSEQDLCAQISSGVAVLPDQCDDVNGQSIRILPDPLFPEDGHPFISTVTDADVAFPSSFPAAPPADFNSLP